MRASLLTTYFKYLISLFLLINVSLFSAFCVSAQPNWAAIKQNASFIVPDASYNTPYIQPLHIGGWEDGLYISRDGLRLYSYFMPFDVFSLYEAWAIDPDCFDAQAYFRPPLLENDTISNPWGCPNFFQGDIIICEKEEVGDSFESWQASNLIRSVSNEGAPCAVSKNAELLDVFVFTQNRNEVEDMELLFMKNVPNNPTFNTATPILSSAGEEDNPHIERLDSSTLLLVFDRDRFIYYSISTDNGITWQTPVLITQVINDQSPYDVQPHLWNDGTFWWLYFCADNSEGKRCIYKSKQLIPNNWDSWGAKELVIEPDIITGNFGTIIGVGEPSLTQWGDLSFVVVYGDLNSTDPTDVFDCDPWMLPKIGSPLSISTKTNEDSFISVYPNPVADTLNLTFLNDEVKTLKIFNNIGQLVKTFEMNRKTSLDVSHFPGGVYYVQVVDVNLEVVKFVKVE